MSRALAITAYVLAAWSVRPGMRPAEPVHLNQSRITDSALPGSQWRFFMRAPKDAEDSPTMWIQRDRQKPVFLGELSRDAELHWCPQGDCLLVIEEPSIESSRLKLYPLNSASLRAVAALDEGIRRHIRERIGSKAEILFYGLRVVGWLPGNRVVIAAQARYAEVPGKAGAAIVTEGFVVQLPDGTIERKLSSEELKNEYGFDGRIV